MLIKFLSFETRKVVPSFLFFFFFAQQNGEESKKDCCTGILEGLDTDIVLTKDVLKTPLIRVFFFI